jgi:hypothetical protein
VGDVVVGDREGDNVGLRVGDSVGLSVGESVGLKVGDRVGLSVGERVGLKVGDSVAMHVLSALKEPVSMQLAKVSCPGGQSPEHMVHDSSAFVPDLNVPAPHAAHDAVLEVAPNVMVTLLYLYSHGLIKYRPGPHVVVHAAQVASRPVPLLNVPAKQSVHVRSALPPPDAMQGVSKLSVCVYVCMHACVCVRVSVRVYVCVRCSELAGKHVPLSCQARR